MVKKEKAPKKQKAPKEPKKQKAPKKRKEPRVIEDVIATILTVLLVIVGICDVVLAVYIGWSYVRKSLTPASASVVVVSQEEAPENPPVFWTQEQL